MQAVRYFESNIYPKHSIQIDIIQLTLSSFRMLFETFQAEVQLECNALHRILRAKIKVFIIVLKLDCNSEYVAHFCRKEGLF